MTSSSQDARRISSLLADRRVSGVAMLVVLSVGLLFGLVGFAVHTLWIVSVISLALGLGYVVANVRQDRNEIVVRDLGGDPPGT